MNPEFLQKVKKKLAEEGYTVVKTKSYLAAQRRQRGADMQRQAAEEHAEAQKQWAYKIHDEVRELRERITFVYGVARAHGATHEELSGSNDQ